MLRRTRKEGSGKPISLAVPIPQAAAEQGRRFEFKYDLQKEIQEYERLKRAKVAVISVVGAFRKGKSFLLNFFLRFLRALERGDTNNWIWSSDTLNDGFPWRSGCERDTTGILMWSEPFFIRKPNGEEVAVLLMDTQGTFDHQSTQQDCTTIFAFSTLLSSVQIFNISQNIQETDLQYLRLFIEFAKMASSSNSYILQHLWFLIRDWQNPAEHAYGLKGGEEYLSKVLSCNSKQPRENQLMRQEIREKIELTSCCLFPHPGKAVASSNFRGEISRLDEDFVQHLVQFIARIAAPQHITVKRLNGRELNGEEFFQLIDRYSRAFSSGHMPTPRSIYTATLEMVNAAAAENAIQFFENRVHGVFDTKRDSAYFERAVSGIADQALQRFDSLCMEPGSPATQQERQKLQRDLAVRRSRQTSIFVAQLEKIQMERRNEELEKQRRAEEKANRIRERMMKERREAMNRQLAESREAAITREAAQRLLAEEAARQDEERRASAVRTEELQRRLLQQQLERFRLLSAMIRDTGKNYCGARLNGPPCDCCDGNCGPANGCNCADCMRKDLEKRHVPPGRTALVNREGFLSMVSPETGWFYCGRPNMGHDRTTDGFCGPDNGYNCHACDQLDRQARGRYASIVSEQQPSVCVVS